MSTSQVGKKNKKSSKKNKTVSLQDFLGTTASAGTVIAQLPSRSWADECDDEEDTIRTQIDLPTAPRASRMLNDDSIPTSPPFQAYLSNLPYDLVDEEIEEFFVSFDLAVKSVRLPRDDNESGRLRGYGYVEFDTREDLIEAVSLPDPTLRGRRIRVDVSSENDNKGRQNRGNRNYDNYNSSSNNDGNTDWRAGMGSNDSSNDRGDREGRSERRHFNKDFGSDRNNRDAPDSGDGGNWRGEVGERPTRAQMADSSPPPARREYSGRRDGDRNNRDRPRNFDRREQEPMERPKITIAPRTLPMPELVFPTEDEKTSNREENKENDDFEKEPPKPKPVPVPAANIFGKAKPVDTAAREREIEERLEKERLKKIEEAKEARELRDKEEAEQREKAAAELSVQKSETPIADEPEEEPPKREVQKTREEDIGLWRKRTDENDNNENGQDGRREGSPTRKGPVIRRIDDKDYRPRDDRPRDNRDNRDRPFRDNRDNRDNRNRDYRDRTDYRSGPPSNRTNDRRRDDRRDNRDNRDAPQLRQPRPERDAKEIEERMPKIQPNSGPNLQTTNLFIGLDEEVVD